jgi:ankyrin repeat protein
MYDFSSLSKLREELDSAVEAGDADRLRKLISLQENGNNFVNVNYISADGRTLLHKSCKGGNLSVCRVLAESGASQNIKSKHGWFPIHLASYYGHLDIVLFLLNEKNFKPDSIIAVYDDNGFTKNMRGFSQRAGVHEINSKPLKTENNLIVNGGFREANAISSVNLDESTSSDDSSSDESDDDFNECEQNELINLSGLDFENNSDLISNFNENELALINLLDLRHLEITSEDFCF